MGYCFITSKLVASFKWIGEQLTNLVFYNYPKPAIIYRDFSKGLRVVVVAKATTDLMGAKITNKVELRDPSSLLEAIGVIVGQAI
jgi:hypothetical protein